MYRTLTGFPERAAFMDTPLYCSSHHKLNKCSPTRNTSKFTKLCSKTTNIPRLRTFSSSVIFTYNILSGCSSHTIKVNDVRLGGQAHGVLLITDPTHLIRIKTRDHQHDALFQCYKTVSPALDLAGPTKKSWQRQPHNGHCNRILGRQSPLCHLGLLTGADFRSSE